MLSIDKKNTPPVIANSQHLISLFEQGFYQRWNTRLVGGGNEPEYRPADDQYPYHRIVFTRDYVASALHEIAHWCVAGEARRRQVDYGYWYRPDGRTVDEQHQFEQVEVKPQALEWLFASACGLPFRVSADNLNSGVGASELFKQRIVEQVRYYCSHGVNPRALRWISLLSEHYQTQGVFDIDRYRMTVL